MKTLHVYLLRQVLATLLLTVGVFTGVVLLGNVLKEILALLVNGQVSLMIVLKAVGLLLPYVLAYALPMGLLTSMLLVFGRLSADQELTAAKASGISLLSLASPLILLGAAMSVLCAWVNLELAPKCRGAYKNLFEQFATGNPTTLIPEGRFVRDIPGHLIYAGKVNGTNLSDVLFCKFKEHEKVLDIRAETAVVIYDPAAREVRFEFSNAQVFQRIVDLPNPGGAGSGLDTNAPAGGSEEFTGPRWQPVIIPGVYSSEDPIILPARSGGGREPKISELSFQELLAKRIELARLGISGASPVERKLQSQVEVQMHRQAAYSFACIGFTLVGIPLGIRVHRRETSVGAALAVLLVLAYYGLTLVGQSIQGKNDFMAKCILWTPNLLFHTAGTFLLWRAHRTG